MKEEHKLYLSISAIAIGILIFTSANLNKSMGFNVFLDRFYVIFVLVGLALVLMGGGLVLIWHVRNKDPFRDEFEKDLSPPYLAVGALLMFCGLTLLTLLGERMNAVVIISSGITTVGIIVLVIGLRFYVKEVLLKKKIRRHS